MNIEKDRDGDLDRYGWIDPKNEEENLNEKQLWICHLQCWKKISVCKRFKQTKKKQKKIDYRLLSKNSAIKFADSVMILLCEIVPTISCKFDFEYLNQIIKSNWSSCKRIMMYLTNDSLETNKQTKTKNETILFIFNHSLWWNIFFFRRL